MDQFSEEDFLGDVFWSEIETLNQSSFLPYTSTPINQIWVNYNSSNNGSNSTNLNKRMIEFMKKSSCPIRIETQESESERFHRRKMCERYRREKEKKEYSALHSMLPLGTKMAAKRIQELSGYKEALQRRNHELEVKLAAIGIGNVRSTKIKFKVANPVSGADYIMEVLKCLNSLGSKIRTIQSTFSHQELVAVMDIETEISDADVRKEVQRTLEDAERKFHFHFPEGC
ncbi:transcription factor bHLH92 isoform X2 [Jatropha curcas]|uniref:transcription factor bHLH92 isoform X2 n=1 Tax=Jatropha curcas TaxID=180498 RepID=UPI0018950641|nr:transcription factor bHLH92 isoform X2 [Jatropha curcas]